MVVPARSDVVGEAFTGADAVFWLAPPDPRAESVEAAYVGFTPTSFRQWCEEALKPAVMGQREGYSTAIAS